MLGITEGCQIDCESFRHKQSKDIKNPGGGDCTRAKISANKVTRGANAVNGVNGVNNSKREKERERVKTR